MTQAVAFQDFELYLLFELWSVDQLEMQGIESILPGTGIRPGYFKHMLLALNCSHHHSGRRVWLNYTEKYFCFRSTLVVH